MQFTKKIEETIQKRYSCRTFSKKPFDDHLIEKIKTNLGTALGPFSSSIRFEFIDAKEILGIGKGKIGTYGLVKNARYFIVGIMDKENTNLMDFGFIFEKAILKMTEMGLGTVWLGRAFNQDLVSDYLEISQEEQIPAITPVGYIAENKSIREKLIAFGIRARNRKSWDEVFFENDFNNPLLKNDDAYYTIPLEMVRLAPSARNQQPWRIVKVADIYHFYINYHPILKSMSHFPYIDIGIAMCHFELSLNSQNYTGIWKINDPKIGSTPKNYHYVSSIEVE